MKILITGTAGFIGYHFANRMVKDGHEVVGLDNINDYYDVQLKYDRLKAAGISRESVQYNHLSQSSTQERYKFIQLQLEDAGNLERLFTRQKFDMVCHLAAQAGVRYSLDNPKAYVDSNILGFLNILEACRFHPVKHLVYASSSSVYGVNKQQPYSVKNNVDHPISLYAASKKSNELMAHTYSHLFGLPTTGLRFFTVYGPWGRPDMALFLFTKAILAGEPIKVFNEGKMIRDFTYVDDIVEGIIRVADRVPSPNPNWNPAVVDPAHSSAPYRIYNIGNNQPVQLAEFIEAIEQALGKTAIKELLPMQPGDVAATFADVSELESDTGYKPATTVLTGIQRFIEWYRVYYQV
jgi:UDP-glucuronate 4-epimerase